MKTFMKTTIITFLFTLCFMGFYSPQGSSSKEPESADYSVQVYSLGGQSAGHTNY